MTYVIITFLVLLFLNIYCSSTSQTLFFRSKEATMVEQCLAVAADISQMQVLNATTVANVLEETQFPENSRLIVTNASSMVIYDSMGQASAGSYALLPEILHALAGDNIAVAF